MLGCWPPANCQWNISNKSPYKALMPNCSIESLLGAIESEVSAQKAELSLLVPSKLTLQGVEVSADVGMAIILDKLLSKGFSPAGFIQQSDGRLYRYVRDADG
jgi:hypothetical protein